MEILESLKDYVLKGTLTTEKFPVKDVKELILAENRMWLTDLADSLGVYQSTYNKSISIAVQSGDSEWLKI